MPQNPFGITPPPGPSGEPRVYNDAGDPVRETTMSAPRESTSWDKIFEFITGAPPPGTIGNARYQTERATAPDGSASILDDLVPLLGIMPLGSPMRDPLKRAAKLVKMQKAADKIGPDVGQGVAALIKRNPRVASHFGMPEPEVDPRYAGTWWVNRLAREMGDNPDFVMAAPRRVQIPTFADEGVEQVTHIPRTVTPNAGFFKLKSYGDNPGPEGYAQALDTTAHEATHGVDAIRGIDRARRVEPGSFRHEFSQPSDVFQLPREHRLAVSNKDSTWLDRFEREIAPTVTGNMRAFEKTVSDAAAARGSARGAAGGRTGRPTGMTPDDRDSMYQLSVEQSIANLQRRFAGNIPPNVRNRAEWPSMKGQIEDMVLEYMGFRGMRIPSVYGRTREAVITRGRRRAGKPDYVPPPWPSDPFSEK